MVNFRHFLLPSLIVSILFAAAPAFAEEKAAETTPVIPTPLKVMPAKIKPVQSNGTDELAKAAPERDVTSENDDKDSLETLSPRVKYGFQKDFWDDVTRRELIDFLASPSPASQSRAMRDLALKATLTPAHDLSSSSKPEENIYALRLMKLVNLGSFDDAQKLYKLNESAPPTPLAAEMGIEASFGHGEFAVACLDQKTFDNSLKTSATFWQNVDSFCQALLSPVAGDDDALRLTNASRAFTEIVKTEVKTVEDINKLDFVNTITLYETGKLNTLLSTDDNISKIDDKHIAIMSRYAKPSAVGLSILAQGLKRGLVERNKVMEVIQAVDLKDNSNSYASFLKEYIKEKKAPVLTDALLNLADTPEKEALLYPLYTASEIAFPEGHKVSNLRFLSLTNQELPINLVQSAFPNAPIESSLQPSDTGEMILIKLLLEKAKADSKEAPESRYATLLALDYANYPQKDIKNAYENVFNLTPVGNYVMPMGDILSSLKESANKKRIYQVVIRSLAITEDKPLEQLHPAALYRILEALNSAGLTEETLSLTRETLGNILKK